MFNIATLLDTIKSSIYGRDMRTAIHDAIKYTNDDLGNHVYAFPLDHPDNSVTEPKLSQDLRERLRSLQPAIYFPIGVDYDIDDVTKTGIYYVETEGSNLGGETLIVSTLYADKNPNKGWVHQLSIDYNYGIRHRSGYMTGGIVSWNRWDKFMFELDNSIYTSLLMSYCVSTAKIAPAAVTAAKLAQDVLDMFSGTLANAKTYTDGQINGLHLPEHYKGQLSDISLLPPVSANVGDYYYVLDLGASYDNREGSATWNGTGWDVAPDKYFSPDQTTIELNGAGQLAIKDGGINYEKISNEAVNSILRHVRAEPEEDDADEEAIAAVNEARAVFYGSGVLFSKKVWESGEGDFTVEQRTTVTDPDNGAEKWQSRIVYINVDGAITSRTPWTDAPLPPANIPNGSVTAAKLASDVSLFAPLRETAIAVVPPEFSGAAQPIIVGGGTLDPSFDAAKIYFATLKNADGSALPAGQFKLCAARDGFAAAVNQIFAQSPMTVQENMIIDFTSTGADFRMRNCLTTQVSHNLLPETKRYTVDIDGYVATNSVGTRRMAYWPFNPGLYGNYMNSLSASRYLYFDFNASQIMTKINVRMEFYKQGSFLNCNAELRQAACASAGWRNAYSADGDNGGITVRQWFSFENAAAMAAAPYGYFNITNGAGMHSVAMVKDAAIKITEWGW